MVFQRNLLHLINVSLLDGGTLNRGTFVQKMTTFFYDFLLLPLIFSASLASILSTYPKRWRAETPSRRPT